METLTRLLLDNNLAEQVVTDNQLRRLLDGSAQRRYNLVNRALHARELWRLRRGHYLVAPSVSGYRAHPFVIAQALHPGGYISFETALAHHGCIPEAVPLVRVVTPGRRRFTAEVPGVADFQFLPLPLNREGFLQGVAREVLAGHPALVAKPLRALLDILCQRKDEWPGRAALQGSMRFDPAMWRNLDLSELDLLHQTYMHRRMGGVIEAMRKELAG